MRKLLLTSVAVTALLAGPTVANAQTRSEQQPPAASTDQQAPKAQTGEPKARARDDMGAPKAGQAAQPERRGTSGSAQPSPTTERAKNKPDATGQGAARPEDRSKGAQKSGGSDMKKDTTGSSQ